MTYEPPPCKFDHNGECLICDCTPKDCAWFRLLNRDFTYESEEELLAMFGLIKVDVTNESRPSQ